MDVPFHAYPLGSNGTREGSFQYTLEYGGDVNKEFVRVVKGSEEDSIEILMTTTAQTWDAFINFARGSEPETIEIIVGALTNGYLPNRSISLGFADGIRNGDIKTYKEARALNPVPT